jgi:hypothetical protein
MIYETLIGIEVAGIRRSIPVAFTYRVRAIKGKPTAIYESAVFRLESSRLPGNWVCDVLGPRQLGKLEGELLAQWAAETIQSGSNVNSTNSKQSGGDDGEICESEM